uniref:Microtubule-associated protein 70-5 n=1 Tax=Kalanchoe fedtschenkoi TaxID=63787 RepID=A0A7N0UD18_KALFE
MVGFEESGRRNEHPVASQSDPVVLEINRLQNQLKDKKRELGAAQSEIKALKATDAAKDRALEELENDVDKLDERLRVAENLLEQKNLEISRLVTEKKDALAAQCAAEATLRRVYASHKDSDSIRIESFIAPLEAENKIYRNEIAALQEDKKTLERLTKSKELALLEAEKILESALERALIVEEVQNENIDLRRQIEICLEENKILDKTNRQKVVEVEKLSQTVRELEEAILAAGSAANTIRDCQRQISEQNEEKRVLERELARARVAANRVAAVVANEWKDESERVMPVKQWLEERRLLQAEMQRLRDKLTVSERAAKAETQLKEKLQLRLKTLEDGLKRVVTPCASTKTDKPNQLLGLFSGKVVQRKRSSSQPRASRASPLQQPNGNDAGAGDLKRTSSFRTDASAQNLVMRNLWATRCKVADPDTPPKEAVEEKTVIQPSKSTEEVVSASADIEAKKGENQEAETNGNGRPDGEDMVSGFLYDRLQKEVINLRKLFEAKECELNSKDEEIKNLTRKVDALTKSIEVESRKIKREFFAKEKEAALSKSDENKSNRNLNLSKRSGNV